MVRSKEKDNEEKKASRALIKFIEGRKFLLNKVKEKKSQLNYATFTGTNRQFNMLWDMYTQAILDYEDDIKFALKYNKLPMETIQHYL